ncbi:MAG: flagellar basal body rod protein FlgC [Nitriliruptoraceae bacterium]
MSAFSSMNIGRTGVGMAHHWIDKISHNLANANTVTSTDEEPFRALRQVARPLGEGPFARGGSGVHAAAVTRDESDPVQTFEPGHPLADEDGMVQQAVVDTGAQMVDMMLAQRHYQVNMQTVKSAHESYKAALQLGRG